MRSQLSASVLLFVFLGLASSGKAAEGGRDSLTFLNLGIGARPMAMGGAFTAVADDVNALFYNPAGLSKLNYFEASLLHQRWIAGLSYSYFGMAVPIRGVGTFAGSFLYFGTPEIQAFDEFNQPAGTFRANDQAFSASFGRSLWPNLAGGLSVKYIREILHRSGAEAFSFDFGVLYQIHDTTHAGAFLGNIGTSLKHHKDSLLEASRQARIMRIGISTRIINPKFLTSAEFTKQFDDDPEMMLGVEYEFAKVIALRAGYAYEFGGRGIKGISGVSGGIGFNSGSVRVDYALSPWGDLGLTHTIGFTYAALPRQEQDDLASRREGPPTASMKKILDMIFFGNSEKALMELGRLSIEWPKDAQIFLYTGMGLSKLGRRDKALAYFNAARKFSEPGSEVRESAERSIATLEPGQP